MADLLPHPERRRLLLKLQSIAELTGDEKQAILGLPMVVKTLPADHEIVSIGDHPSHCCLLLEGWACRYKMLPDGSRQIMSFHIPGDIPDLQSLYLAWITASARSFRPRSPSFSIGTCTT